MKDLLTAILTAIGLAGSAQAQPAGEKIDPNSILFSTPTISNDIAPLEAVSQKSNNTDVLFHEDEWSQVEFFQKAQLSEIQNTLKEYKNFEQKNRTKSGWKKTYLRKIDRSPVVFGDNPIKQLESLLGVNPGPAPILFTTSAISGRVKNGFTFPLGGNVTLYGYTENDKVMVLGANVGESPDDMKLTQAFAELNLAKGLIIVDWRAQLILVSVSSSGQIEVWRP